MVGFFSARRVFKYAVMPEFFSRVQNLTASGFQNVAYLIAVIYQMVRLLPANHPYLDYRNIGRFGVRHVIAEAANNLVFSRKNIDQIILFFVILIGMVMLVLQVFLLGASLLMHPVSAAPVNWNQLFVVANPEQDIAYIMLDLVFGVRNPAAVLPLGGGSFFGSCVGSPIPCMDSFGLPIQDIQFPAIIAGLPGMPNPLTIGPLSTGAFAVFPFPIHYGMQALFGMYNLGLLMVAVMIISYFIATVVAETAQSGTPFGKRFNKLWAPIRIVMAIGLLMPLFAGLSGLNSAQYIVLYAAKYGSAFATNGWNRFNDTLAANYRIASVNDAISTPTAPDMSSISLFMWLVNVCYHITQNQAYGIDSATGFPKAPPTINAYVIGRQSRLPNAYVIVAGTLLNDVLKDFLDPYPKMVVIRFGEKSEKLYPKEDGFVKPICGEIQIPITDGRHTGMAPNLPAPGVVFMQEYYFNLIKNMWYEDTAALSPYVIAQAIPAIGGNLRSKAFALHGILNKYVGVFKDPLTMNYVSAVNTAITNQLEVAIGLAVVAQKGNPLWLLGPCASGPGSTLRNKGWGAAGIWYNCIAELNGSLTSAVTAIPVATRSPDVMENVAALKAQYNTKNSGQDFFQPTVAGQGDTGALLNFGNAPQAAQILYEAHRQWMAGQNSTQTKASNPFSAAVSTFLGVNGLYDMRKNANVHPLAQLVGIGRALVEASVRKLGYAVVGAGMAAGINAAGGNGGLVGVASSMLVTIAMLGLSSGFVLFYIVPFLPFLYFFFAMGGWVKGIFEAMVGAPLWALAHIRIDGNGLPGNAAMNGYFLIFEIFVRPILTVFGLLASVSIFAALVSALNIIFDLVVNNVSGFDIKQEITGAAADSIINSMRGTIDEFFYTIIYAVIVYMMAMSSFKLIDQIPNNILRWMGQSVATFGDSREDPAQGLMSKASMGAQQGFSRMGGGMQGLVGGISSAGK